MANRAKFTPEKKLQFLEFLATSGNVTGSAKRVGVSTRTTYDHRAADPEFSSQWDDAIREATDALEAEVRRRGHDGVEEPVFYQGQQVATIRKYSDVLLIFLLKAHDHKFRDHHKVDVGGQKDNPLKTEKKPSLDHLTAQEKTSLRELAHKALLGGGDD